MKYLKSKVDGSVSHSVYWKVSDSVWDSVHNSVSEHVWNSIRNPVSDKVHWEAKVRTRSLIKEDL